MGSASNAGYVILLIIFVIGVLVGLGGWFAQMATPITEKAHLDYGNWKLEGVIMIIIAVGIGFGVNSGTGKPYGDRRYKGMAVLVSSSCFFVW